MHLTFGTFKKGQSAREEEEEGGEENIYRTAVVVQNRRSQEVIYLRVPGTIAYFDPRVP